MTRSATVTFTEFADLVQPLRIKNRCKQDCEPVTVLVNAVEVGTLEGGDQLVVPYDGTPFQTIQLNVLHIATESGSDYIGFWDVLLTVANN